MNEADIVEELVPIVAIMLGLGTVVVAIVFGYREKMKRAELRHRERITALEKGIELPPDADPELDGRRSASLRRGLAGLFVGIVLYAAMRGVTDPDIAIFGLVPSAIGAANLIGYFVERSKNGSGPAGPG